MYYQNKIAENYILCNQHTYLYLLLEILVLPNVASFVLHSHTHTHTHTHAHTHTHTSVFV